MNVNEEKLQKVGRFAMEVYNKNSERLIDLRVVNGLPYTINGDKIRIFIIVIEAINDDGIPWSYNAKVEYYVFNPMMPQLLSFSNIFLERKFSIHTYFQYLFN